ncbi:MAG: acyltransferase [Oscillatoriales cyanobacterium SM2_1_8]|nr:acyltransferase [Oscillatoriales cyanobacterium SM2_1_8]
MVKPAMEVEGADAQPNVQDWDALGSLRAIAAFFIVLAHCHPPRAALQVGDWDLSWLLFAAGGVYLRLFFVLSGYLTGKVFWIGKYELTPGGVWRFWQNRWRRIAPLYYFAVLFLTVLLYTHLLQRENWGYLLQILTFTYNHALPVDFNRALWAVSTEMQFYAIAPFAVALIQKFAATPRRATLAAIAVALAVTLYRGMVMASDLQDDIVTYWYTPLPANLDAFVGGMLLNVWLQHPPRFAPRFRATLAAIGAIGLHLVTAYYIYFVEERNLPGRSADFHSPIGIFGLPLAAVLVFGWVIYSLEAGEAYRQRPAPLSFAACLQNPLRLLEALAQLSYGIYVWHMPVLRQIAFAHPVVASDKPFTLFVGKLGVTLLLSGLLATVTYRAIEQPARAIATRSIPTFPFQN